MRPVPPAIALALALAFGAAACSSDSSGSTARAGIDGVAPGPPITAPALAPAERPARLGTTSRVGDYDVTLERYEPDATAGVEDAGRGNQPPAKGRYARLTVRVVNRGRAPVVPSMDLLFAVLGGDGSTNRHYDCTAWLARETLLDGARIDPGGTKEGDVCFDLTPAAAAGTRLVVTTARTPFAVLFTSYWVP
ncbi:MAG: hypothetical protein JWM89_940 [Acidimicrobiales bacterium]|nr:hypothetical protein [Acidimicrobiales bacterium]